jgi:predicted PurR-regulated permease PerM
MDAPEPSIPQTLGARILRPATLWDRVIRYGLFATALSAILAFLYVLFTYVFAPLKVVVVPLAIAVVISYLLNPLVTKLEHRGIRRGFSVLMIYVVFLGVVGFLMSRVVPLITHQVSAFISDLPRLMSRVATLVNDFADKRDWNFHLNVCSPDEVACPEGYLSFKRLVTDNRDKITQFLGGVGSFAASALHIVLNLVLGLVFSVYLLLDLPKFKKGIRNLIPGRHQAEVQELGENIGRVLGSFFRGQLLVAAFVGAASAIGLTFIKIPFAALVGMIAGIFNLVPMIGPFIGAIPAVILGLLSGEPIRALWGMLWLLVVQQIDNHIISPNVMGRTVKLHPITVMLSLLIGGTMAGIFGMLLVIPLVAVVKMVSTHMWARRSVREAIAPVMVEEEDRKAAAVAEAAAAADEALFDDDDQGPDVRIVPAPAPTEAKPARIQAPRKARKPARRKPARRASGGARSSSSRRPSRGSRASRSPKRSASTARRR